MQLDPHRSAVIVVDMQNDFCHPDGYYARSGRDISALAAAAEPVAALVGKARAAGAKTVFTRLVHDAARGAMEDRHQIKPKRWSASGERLMPGSWGAEVIDALAPGPDALIVDKAGYSAFHDTPLASWLKARNVKTVILCGVVTYACVLATGFSAFDNDFDVLVATDAVGSWSAELGDATGQIVELLLGRTLPIDAIDFAVPDATVA